MATDPRIRYDIAAGVTGSPEVEQLAIDLERVDAAVDANAAVRAQQLAAQLRILGQQQAALSTFVELKTRTEGAAVALADAQRAAQTFGRELAGVSSPTRTQTAQMDRLAAAVRAAKTDLTAQTAALDASRAALSRLGLETEGAARAQVRVRNELAAASIEAKTIGERYATTAAAAGVSASKQVAANATVRESLTGIRDQLSQLQSLAALAIGGGVLGGIAKDLAATADGYSNLAARIKLATGEGAAFDAAFEGVFDVARRTNTSLETTGNLFVRITEAGRTLGVSQRQALALTETINEAVQLSGSSADASDAAVRQLIQGLQSGVLRGDEFNSVMEQAPRLAKALSDGLGVTTGRLRELAEAGQLTSTNVIQALTGQSQTLRREFEQLPPTVGRAIQGLSTEWTRYIGEVDKANGISRTAAEAIGFLAKHLSELATAARFAGEAWLAWKAIDLAGTLLRQVAATEAAAAAVTLETRAVVANTVATTANTAAKTANAAATGAAASSSVALATSAGGILSTFGRVAGAVGLAATGVALFGDLALSTFKGAGTAIGEFLAKYTQLRDRGDEVAAMWKADDAAARANAAALAEVAQQAKIAGDRAAGLNTESQKLIGTFEDARKKGETTAEALEKVQKGLRLDDISGIQAATTALDVLRERAQITGQQVREALGDSLKGLDLGVFETQARAAFDKTTQGARRLQDVLDAIADESLKRAGTSIDELRTGFSKASASAINDVDALAHTLEQLGVAGTDAERALASALDKATAAASTARAAQTVIDRIVELGKQGKLTGEVLTASLEQARRKLADLVPGVQTLDEALRDFGLHSRTELTATADRLSQSWEQISRSTRVSLQEQITAFGTYAEAAVKANGGILPSQVALQAKILEMRADVAGLGKEFAQAMDAAAKATNGAIKSLSDYQKLLRQDPSRLVGGNGLGGISNDTAAKNAAVKSVLAPTGSAGTNVDGSAAGGFLPFIIGPNGERIPLNPKDRTAGGSGAGGAFGGGLSFTSDAEARAIAFGAVQGAAAAQQVGTGSASTPDTERLTADHRYVIDFNLGTNRYRVTADDQDSAEGLVRDLEQAFRLAKGG